MANETIARKPAHLLEGIRKRFFKSKPQLTRGVVDAQNWASAFVMSTDAVDMNQACVLAMNRSDYVRNVAQLAVWAAKELQDRAANHNDKTNEDEERTMLLRLAWLLDRLAQLTGYNPDAEQLLSGTTSPPIPTTKTSSSTKVNASSNLELIAQATGKSKIQSSPVTAVKTIRKRSIDNNPMLSVMKYYVKHKLWTNSNQNYFKQNNRLENTDNFISNNDLIGKKRDKRSLKFINSFVKPGHISSKIQPQNLKVIVEKLFKTKFNLIKKILPNKAKIHKRSIENMELSPDIGNFKTDYSLRNVDEINIYDTEVNYDTRFEPQYYNIKNDNPHKHNPVSFYGRPVQAKIPENPQQDISAYVKIRPGTSIRPDPAQTALVRLALQRIFETGNIDVIKTYGSNYNPANRNALVNGVLQTASDV